jgi:predicted nucleic acid-binding protein
MSVKAFIDTNIFIYIQRTDSLHKRQIAEDAVNYFDCIASTQVLNEIANVFTKKYPMPVEKVERLLKSICEVSEIIVINEELIDRALHLHQRYKVPYYDCLIIAAAIYSGCQYLISEDMQDGLFVENALRIVNIFNHTDLFLTDNP